MKLSDRMENAINEQIHAEMESAYLYLSMAASCEHQSLAGFAHWFKRQFTEEQEHAMKLYAYLLARGGCVKLKALGEPKVTAPTMTVLFEETLAHEQDVSKRISALYALAQQEGDFATMEHLGWFLREQVEEESAVTQILAQLKMAGDRPGTLIYIDKHMAKRA